MYSMKYLRCADVFIKLFLTKFKISINSNCTIKVIINKIINEYCTVMDPGYKIHSIQGRFTFRVYDMFEFLSFENFDNLW